VKPVFLFFFLYFAIQVFSLAQPQEKLKPVAKFSKDSIRIGEPVMLSLSVSYPSKTQILFPDTSFFYGTFDLRKKDYYTTRTIGELSRDCVVYELTTFELDSIQTLQLPVFEFSEFDSTRWFSNEVRLFVKPVFSGPLPQNPVVQEDLTFLAIAKQINYPYILIGLGIVILLILVVNIFFDRPIQKFIYLFLEQRRHTAYLRSFDRFKLQLEGNLNIENMERLLNSWKKYIQRVDGNPYTSLTSMEIFKILQDPVLRDVLQEVDRWIYGGMEMKDFQHNIEVVKQVSIQLYLQKREAIKNGKFE